VTAPPESRSDAFVLPDDLETPAAVVDLDVLDRNVAGMAARAGAAGVALRPHAKTHKSIEVARRQLAAGAVGLTVATLTEATDLADAGCDDLFIAYPFWAGGERGRALQALNERVQLRVGVDSEEGAAALARATGGASHPLQVMLELDCGQRRTGVSSDAVAALAQQCLRLGLEVVGAFTHPGHAYATPDAPAAAAQDERDALARARDALLPVIGPRLVLSGGSTPTAAQPLGDVLDEVRPGTYVFGDAQQQVLTGLPLGSVALLVAARVVSRPRAGEAVLDAGSKTLSADRPPWLPGHGNVVGAPTALVRTLTEEHAVVTGAPDGWRVGDVVAVVPNHVCTTVNLARRLAVCSGGLQVATWEVGTTTAAQGS
jgi:D-serine deaminase-like pyridoxal phosphate-dependent protein